MLKEFFQNTDTKPSEKKTKQARGAAQKGQEEPKAFESFQKKCPGCKAMVSFLELEKNDYICPRCGNYFRIQPRTRLDMILDKDTFEEWDGEMESADPLHFPGYGDKLAQLKQATGLREAVVTGKGSINGLPVAIGVMGTDFMMGSMGQAVGEKIARAVERATAERLPVVIFTCSGGARMQEGMVSLMQMAKTSAALKRHDEAGLLYLAVLTDPTTGGVTASFAMLGDVILAEPGALIGFAGPRVISQTMGQKLPEGFQTAEFLLSHGFVDKIVERKNLKYTLYALIRSCPGC